MNDLMTLDEIAQMFRCNAIRAKELVKFPGFPKESPTSTPRMRRWVRAEVRAYKPAMAGGVMRNMRRAEADVYIAKRDQIEARSAANRRHHRGKRRAAMLQRTPPWADLKAIEAVYRAALRLEEETGIPHHVDHVIPLQGRMVSGLHVETNLRALPWKENASKGNRFEVAA